MNGLTEYSAEIGVPTPPWVMVRRTLRGVYGLRSSADKTIRYVGQSNDIWRRLQEHRSPQCAGRSFAWSVWYRELQETAAVMHAVPLEVVQPELPLDIYEHHWIALYQRIGQADLNINLLGKAAA